MPRKCPKGTICIENYTILFLLFFLAIILYFVYKNYFCTSCNQPLSHNHHNLPPHQHMFNVSSDLHPIPNPSMSYNNHPTDTLMNPYTPPVQYNQPHNYKQIGYLKNENHGNKLFPIFAKPIHLRRDKWYYYTIFDNIKVPIYSNGRKCSSEHGCDSLSNGDMVNLESMNDTFAVSMYDNHTLSYDPVI